MRILLVGEGPHELGHGSQKGALEVLVARLLRGKDTHLVIKKKKFNDPDVPTHGKKGNRVFHRIMQWISEAQKMDALVLVIDCDRDPRRVAKVTEAQRSTRSALRRALGVAIQEFDAWMLADEKALKKACDVRVHPPEKPEELDDPKDSFCRLLKRPPEAKTYAKIAAEARIEIIEKRCPRGFAPFPKRVRALTCPSASSTT